MAKASSIDITGPTSFLFKSPWGFGKTLAAASFALTGPTYLAYIDKKKPVELRTFFQRFGEKGRRILDNLEYDVYDGSNINKYLNKVIDMSDSCKYTAFITDSATMLTSATVTWSLGFNDKGKKVAIRTDNPQQIIPKFDEYKAETSIIAQSLDMCRALPCHVIWTAHPLPGIKIEGSGGSMKVSKVNTLVTFGTKVAGLIPGQFTEIYHFTKGTNYNTDPISVKYGISTEAIGDEFAKTALGLPGELDFTNRLFYEVWLEALQKVQRDFDNQTKEQTSELNNPSSFNPFANPANPTITAQPEEKKPTWNSQKGEWE